MEEILHEPTYCYENSKGDWRMEDLVLQEYEVPLHRSQLIQSHSGEKTRRFSTRVEDTSRPYVGLGGLKSFKVSGGGILGKDFLNGFLVTVYRVPRQMGSRALGVQCPRALGVLVGFGLYWA